MVERQSSRPTYFEEDSKFDFLLRRPSAIKETQFEDSILCVNAAMTRADLRTAICSGLHSILRNVIKTEALIFGDKELSYFVDDGGTKHLKKEGVIWKVIRQRQMELFKDIEDIDPIWDILGVEGHKVLDEDRVALVFPVVNRNELKVLGIMIAFSDPPSEQEMIKIEWMQKNSLIAIVRIHKYNFLEQEKVRAEGMLKVCGSLMDFEISLLSIKINSYLRSLLNCKLCLLFIADEASMDLISHVFGDKPINELIRFPMDNSIYGTCYTSSKVIFVEDAAKDARINPAIDFKFVEDYEFTSMICVPVKGRRNSTPGDNNLCTIGVAACFDKLGPSNCFTDEDRASLSYSLQYCSSMISNTIAYQRELTLKKQNEALLSIAKNLFTRLNDPDVLLNAIMQEARELIKAEKCSLFLVDNERQELVATVFDSAIAKKDNESVKLRIPVGQGIAGYVAKSGETVNIKDAYKHPMFYKEVDKSTGFKTRNILCIPIVNNEGVVGVAQLVNKRNGRFFTLVDEELAKSFSVYCGISIYHSLLYRNVVTEQSRSRLATELMVYHMEVQTNDIDKLAIEGIPPLSSFNEHFLEFSFSPREISSVDITPMVVISMAQGMGLLEKWKISRQKMAKFVLMVKHGYRDMPYHNWWHALEVTHFCCLLFHHCDHLSLLSDLEIFALFISCLCHDIDHRGTNNAFQLSSNSILASLYSSKGSVMERHHLAQTLCILNSRGCNILENLSPQEYRRTLDLIRDNILATDLAIHLGIHKEIDSMAEQGFSSDNSRHHYLLNSLIMTSCDLTASTKSWKSSSTTSKLIYKEFFYQGDLEKALGTTPSTMMDRDKAYIPDQQINFSDIILQPAYSSLAKLFPVCDKVLKNIQSNRDMWVKLKLSEQEDDY